jgi:hypothetical protein
MTQKETKQAPERRYLDGARTASSIFPTSEPVVGGADDGDPDFVFQAEGSASNSPGFVEGSAASPALLGR